MCGGRPAGVDVNLSDVLALVYVVGFVVSRVERRDWRMPRTSAIVGGFFLAFALVYLIGFFNLETTEDLSLFAKGIGKFAVHFAFLVCAIAHVARRSDGFYWRTLGWFVAGIAVNAAYGLVELAYAETAGGNLDQLVLPAHRGYQRGGINVYGAVGGANVYRTNALTLDPNHLGIILIVPLLVLLPVYLRLERGHRLRRRRSRCCSPSSPSSSSRRSRAAASSASSSDSLVLAIPYRRFFLSPRLARPARPSLPESSSRSSRSAAASSSRCCARERSSRGRLDARPSRALRARCRR